MKRLLTFLLLSFYTLSSVGASVSTHYCMGKIIKCQCAKPKEGSKDHCCKDTVKFVKSQDIHAAQVAPELKKQVCFDYADVPTLLMTKYNAFDILYHPTKIYLSSATAPPIYKLVCNYRI
jgi:hypothetical protein